MKCKTELLDYNTVNTVRSMNMFINLILNIVSKYYSIDLKITIDLIASWGEH